MNFCRVELDDKACLVLGHQYDIHMELILNPHFASQPSGQASGQVTACLIFGG